MGEKYVGFAENDRVVCTALFSHCNSSCHHLNEFSSFDPDIVLSSGLIQTAVCCLLGSSEPSFFAAHSAQQLRQNIRGALISTCATMVW